MWSDLILLWACRPHLAGEVSRSLYCTIQCDTALPLACSTQHNLRVIEGNQYTCLWSKNYFLPLELCKKPALFQFLVYFRERKCHESCISHLSFFRVKTHWVFDHATVYRCVYQGAGQELSHNTFFRSKHKSTNHMPAKLLKKTNGVACSTINPLSRCHC